MLSTLKSAARRLPGVEDRLVARNLGRDRFERWMDGYIASRPAPQAGGDPNLARFLSDGALFLPGYFPREKIAPLHDAFLPLLEQVRRGEAPPDWKTNDYGEDGIYRLQNPAVHVPAAQEVIDDPYLRGLAEAYVDGGTGPPSTYVDYKPDLRHDHTSTLHMDSFRAQVKIFVFLSDIGPGNAPLVYWLRSQRDSPWRRDFDYSFWNGSELGGHGHVPVTYLRRARAAGGDAVPEEVEFCGPAGSVVLGDTRGIHRASVLREGYRLELVVKLNEARRPGA